LNRSPLIRALLTSAALAATILLSGCNTDSILSMGDKATRPLSEKMVKDIESKDMDKDSPILVRLFKEEAELEVWKQDRTGHFALLKTYPICRWSGELGPKIKEGDRQAPEGFYNITPGQMNPNSAYYLSFDLGYPNAYVRSYGRTGSQLMVHGDCSSRGCYSMTDEQIAEIYALGRDAFFGGQKSFQVQAYPFRMTAQNLARHRNSPHLAFWKMLKKGNDHFEVSKLEPKVNVCERRYVFDAESPNGRALSFNASAKCPAFQVPEEIATAVKDKERQDDAQFAELSRHGIPTAPIKTYADGGMNKVFVAAVKNNQIGVAPQEALFVTTPPGTIPATVRPPRIPELADAPVVAGVAPAPHPDGDVSSPQMAIAATPPSQPAAKSKSMFSSLFASKGDSGTDKKSDGPLDRVKRLVGVGKDEKKAETAEAMPPAPKPKPAVRTISLVAQHGAIRPKQAAAEPIKTTEAQAPAAAPASMSVPAPKPPPAPTSTAMNGSAPVVPAGNFDNRWSAFR
jgi:murein L,D-transpeptidase YafK